MRTQELVEALLDLLPLAEAEAESLSNAARRDRCPEMEQAADAAWDPVDHAKSLLE